MIIIKIFITIVVILAIIFICALHVANKLEEEDKEEGYYD